VNSPTLKKLITQEVITQRRMFSEENNMFTNYAPIIIATNLEVSKE
jgi:hypothetical protein